MKEVSDKTLSGGRFIAETLSGYGVSHVFYVEAMLRFASLDMEDLGIRRMIVHSEKAAAYMADGYARASGRPGVCMAQSVGAANLAAGLQDARLGCSPVVALTGMKTPEFQYRNAYQEIEHAPLYAPVTKMHAVVSQSDQLPVLMRQAFRVSVSGKPGPVHLDMPNHTGRTIETKQLHEQPSVDKEFAFCPPSRPFADEQAVSRAAEVLKTAKRPVMVVGGGARRSGAGEAILRLAELMDMPIVSTPDGKGVIDESHPLWGGIVGFYSMKCANQIVVSADAVLYAGSQVSDQTTYDWKVPAPGTKIIQIDIEPTELGRNYSGTIGLCGDARTVAEQLFSVTEAADRKAWLEEAAGYVSAWKMEQSGVLGSSNTPILTERLCSEIQNILPDDALLVADTGYSAIWAATLIRLRKGQDFIRAAGSLGWAYPASLGAKCGAPDRTVVCFTGDGAFYYHMAEMETAVRYGIRTVTIVNNNSAFSQGIDEVKKVHRDADSTRDPESMYRFSPVNLSRVAEEFGVKGIRVSSPDMIGSALREALNSPGPVLVEVLTGVESRAPAAWRP
jgi:acetolactate synthase I/II/III large subunit